MLTCGWVCLVLSLNYYYHIIFGYISGIIMKFWVILFLVASIVWSTSSYSTDIDDATLKEILDDPELASLLDDPDKLLDLLRKKFRSQPTTNDEDRCLMATNKANTIIKTKESQENGATFISVPIVADRQECLNACCNDTKCNTAIIKEKVGETTACYLFDCQDPSVCIFSEHTGFASVQFYPRSSSDNEVKHVSTRTTTKPSTMTDSKGELMSSCKSSIDCDGGEQVTCSSGVCVCRHGYHAVDKTCRKDCSPFEFECLNVDRPSVSECIAVYFHCDGIVQCHDGSDEANCKTGAGNVSRTPTASTKHPSTSTAPSTKLLSTSPKTGGSKSSQSPKLEKEDEDDVLVSIVARPSNPAMKGAVVALTLGVSLIALLVIFAGCHLCRVRRRPLKGRLRTPADEDYLINGMYL